MATLSYNSLKTDEIKTDIDPEKPSHSRRKISSIIDLNLWDKAKWAACASAVNNEGLSICLGFVNATIVKKFSSNGLPELVWKT